MSSPSSKNLRMGNYSQKSSFSSSHSRETRHSADKESRSNHVDTEWMLQPKVLNLALEHLSFKPEIDLFATNINTQFGKCAAFRPDPGAMYIDAFSIDCSDLKFYAFPISQSYLGFCQR